ncbi:DNA polymerase III subunit delta' [Bifidobacterium cuniculi]|uniref:DNA polymerase III subunit delta n=1 Tax=Bifidobacterium cuniculi TaxID=1688 RepID=A0A087AWU7_9BIFI|nr:DNA polymerase III subunit delta' [Bifidobacterium cuniculi]KFI63247.1 DNA polymerase III subunit delta [Bifidobacterium cuniculi]
MSVWDSIVGQQQVIDQLRAVSTGDGAAIAQSWLICGPPGSGRSNVARAFAAALQSPDHGLGDEPTRVTRQVLAGTHPDVMTLATDKVTIGIDAVRDLIVSAEQMPTTAPWRIIIIEDVDRMLERTTNVLLKEIEEPSPRTIWLLCAPSAEDVLPTIRSRTRIVSLGVPSDAQVARHLEEHVTLEDADGNSLLGADGQPVRPDHALAMRAARLAEGHIGIATLYAGNSDVLRDRDELVVGLVGLRKASQAILLAEKLMESAKAQAKQSVEAAVAREERAFRQLNGLGPKDRVPPSLRPVYNQIGKKDDVRRQTTRRQRDVLDRALNTVASVYRDVAVLQNDAVDSVGLVNLENAEAITDLSARLSRRQVIDALDEVETARRRLAGNGNPQLVLEALFCGMT